MSEQNQQLAAPMPASVSKNGKGWMIAAIIFIVVSILLGTALVIALKVMPGDAIEAYVDSVCFEDSDCAGGLVCEQGECTSDVERDMDIDEESGFGEMTRDEFIANLPSCDITNSSIRPLPSDENIGKFLGIHASVPADFTLHTICYDEIHNTIGLMYAREVGDVCINSCDEVVIGAFDLNVEPEEAALGYIKSRLEVSESQLGIYTELGGGYCRFDQIIHRDDTDSRGGSYELLFYCGSGEFGGLITWYQYLTDDLREANIVQRHRELPGGTYEFDNFEVLLPEVLEKFNYQSNEEVIARNRGR